MGRYTGYLEFLASIRTRKILLHHIAREALGSFLFADLPRPSRGAGLCNGPEVLFRVQGYHSYIVPRLYFSSMEPTFYGTRANS